MLVGVHQIALPVSAHLHIDKSFVVNVIDFYASLCSSCCHSLTTMVLLARAHFESCAHFEDGPCLWSVWVSPIYTGTPIVYRQVIFVDAVYCYAGLRSSSFIQSDGIFGGSSFWSVRSFWIWPLSIEQPVVSKHQRLWSVEMKCLLGLFSLMTITTLHHCQRIHIQRQIFRTTTSQHKVVSNLEKLP